MTRKTANIGYGSRRTTFSEVTLPEKEEGGSGTTHTPKPQFEITLTFDNIENLDEDKIKEITIRIEHMGKLLSQASQIPVIRESAEINLSAVISTLNPTPQFLDDLLSNPVLVTVLDCTRPTSESTTAHNQTPNIESKKKASKASNSPPIPTKSLSFTLIGMCNLDIGPFVNGERVIRRTLLLEPDIKEAPYEIQTWVKYPRLSVIATSGETPIVSETTKKFSNAIGITIESIYNVPDYIANGALFDASLPVPAVGDKAGRLRFPNGLAGVKDHFPQRKKWLSLTHIEDPGARTAHRISQNYCDVYSSLPPDVNVENEIRNSRRVIRWNTWKNCHMIKDDVNYLFTKLMRHRLWPIEVFLSSKSKEYLGNKNSKPEKKSKQAPSTSSVYPDHFLAFLDLSPFLHPGVTKVRVAAQLLTYSQSELLSKFGAEFISEFGFSSYSQHSITGNRRKSSSVRSKSSVRDLEYESSGILVYNDEHPTFILVEVELLKPFIPKRSIENLQLDLRQHLCLKEKMTPKKTTCGLMKQNFSRSLMSAVAILCEEYSKYHRQSGNEYNENADATVNFQKYLQQQENFHRMKASLEKAVVDLVREKFGSIKEYEEKIPQIYVYLVNEMHKVTNKCLLGHSEFSSRTFYTDKLQLYAEEAFEEGDFELAKRYLLLKLSRHTSNPDYWLDCAVFHIKLKNYDEAIEAVREALALDFSHQMGLLMYALLMAKYSYISLAETTFDILLTKYPNFIEGWMALSLVYSVFSNFEGSRVALQEAIKMEFETHKESNTEPNETEAVENEEFAYKSQLTYPKCGTEVKYGMGSFKDGMSNEEPLSWTISFSPPENIFIKSTILLLKLGFYEYAGLSLAEELLSGSKNGKPSLPFIYYTSVNYYLQGRYEEAIPILQKTVEQYGKDCFLRSLMGHCFFKLDNHSEAISCYEYVKEAYNRPNDIHLVYLRMGYYYLELKKFTCAKQAFVIACKYSPSPKLWKGVGLACLELEEAQEAEIAFSEANYLDNTDSETWAYLALTNAYLHRIDLFQQCYLEARKVRDLVLSLSLVCKRFHEILSDENFWKSLIAKRWNYNFPFQSIDNENFDWKKASFELERQYNLWKSKEETIRRMNILPNVHIAAVDAVVFVNKSICVSASRDRSLVIWNPIKSTNKFPSYVQKDAAHDGWIWRLQYARDSLYSCSWDSTVKIWAFDKSDFHLKSTYRCSSPVLSLALMDGVVVAGDYGKNVSGFDPRCGEEPVFKYNAHRRAVLTLGAMGSEVISGSEDKTILVWDTRTRNVKEKILLGKERFPNCSCINDNILYVGDSKGCVHVFNKSGGSLKRLKIYNIGHQKPISVIKNGSSYLLTGSHDGTVKVSLPIQPLKVLTSIKTSRGEVGGMDYKGGILAIGTSNYLEFWMPKEYVGSDDEIDSNIFEAGFRTQFD